MSAKIEMLNSEGNFSTWKGYVRAGSKRFCQALISA